LSDRATSCMKKEVRGHEVASTTARGGNCSDNQALESHHRGGQLSTSLNWKEVLDSRICRTLVESWESHLMFPLPKVAILFENMEPPAACSSWDGDKHVGEHTHLRSAKQEACSHGQQPCMSYEFRSVLLVSAPCEPPRHRGKCKSNVVEPPGDNRVPSC
jgi:hypothetical protein